MATNGGICMLGDGRGARCDEMRKVAFGGE